MKMMNVDLNKGFVMQNVFPALVSEGYVEAHEGCLCDEFLDLKEVYRVRVDGNRQIPVNDKLLDVLGISEKEIKAKARENGKGLFRWGFLSSIMGLGDDGGIVVVSNDDAYFGSGAMMYTDIFREISDAEFDGGDLFILPSSIHELIVVPAELVPGEFDDRLKVVRDMVATVNDTQVRPDEQLSYSVYVYDREDNVVDIARTDAELCSMYTDITERMDPGSKVFIMPPLF